MRALIQKKALKNKMRKQDTNELNNNKKKIETNSH